MEIIRVLNNNAVQARTDSQEELVVMGKGLGFKAKVGELVNESKVDKIFVLHNEGLYLKELFQEITVDEMEVANWIIDYAEDKLDESFAANLFITLVDHIHHVVARAKKNEQIRNPLAWTVQRQYPREYSVGKKSVEMIENKFNVQLIDSEAASIALHLINARSEGSKLEETYQTMNITEQLLHIIELIFGMQLDENSISFTRFVTHLQFLAQRIALNEIPESKDDAFLYEQVQKNYPKAFESSMMVKKFVEAEYDYPIGKDELVYLTIHIHRVFDSLSN